MLGAAMPFGFAAPNIFYPVIQKAVYRTCFPPRSSEEADLRLLLLLHLLPILPLRVVQQHVAISDGLDLFVEAAVSHTLRL